MVLGCPGAVGHVCCLVTFWIDSSTIWSLLFLGHPLKPLAVKQHVTLRCRGKVGCGYSGVSEVLIFNENK